MFEGMISAETVDSDLNNPWRWSSICEAGQDIDTVYTGMASIIKNHRPGFQNALELNLPFLDV